ncbi:hypothetical protein NDU88_007675 [Pleurodeles waltl]|uniref:Uncharacterized protein n=1 Tax=Pleurodeles waltl TaxID=8319 RepID=A0AAV7N2V6_PLEWA|nr:hypothetical protein NDU88_007675 [Pleurodeles waltl]
MKTVCGSAIFTDEDDLWPNYIFDHSHRFEAQTDLRKTAKEKGNFNLYLLLKFEVVAAAIELHMIMTRS